MTDVATGPGGDAGGAPLEGFPISPFQERLVSAFPGGNAPSVTLTVRLAGADPSRLAAAWRAVVQRHELLRSIFHRTPAVRFPVQVIRDGVACEFEKVVSAVDALPPRWDRESMRPFDLETGPVITVEYQSPAAGQQVLTLRATAMVADATSLRVLCAELVTLYANGDLPVDPLQYADYASYSRELVGADSAVSVPEDASFPGLPFLSPVESGEGSGADAIVLPLDGERMAKIRALAAERDWDVSDVIRATWVAVMHRVSGQVEFPLRAARDVRPAGEELAVGPYSEPVTVRYSIDPASTFTDLVGQSHDDGRLQPAQRIGLPDLVGFSTEPGLLPTTDEIQAVLVSASSVIEPSALGLVCLLETETPHLVLTFDARRFPPQAMERTARYLERLLDRALAEPDAPIAASPLLSQAEERLLRDALRGPELAWQPTTVDALIAAQALRRPDQVAIRQHQVTLTYRELDQRASAFATRLQAAGAGPGTMVGLFMDRSPELVVALLAILKTGAAYVPVDPAYPAGRQRYVLRDAAVPVVVASTALSSRLEGIDATILAMEDESPVASDGDAHAERTAAQSDPAYVIYTSGSTGSPRGVIISHGNLSWYVQAMARALDIREGDVYLHTASFAFSSSVRQLLVPLSLGASVSIASDAERTDVVQLLETILETGVTVVDLVPSHWRAIVDVLSRESTGARHRLLDNALRLILSASEPLGWDLPRIWREGFGHPARMVNMFGQTETTGIATVYPIEVISSTDGVVPVGRPLPGCEAVVLDHEGFMVPEGVGGELWLTGPGVGMGYLNLPEATTERFRLQAPGESDGFPAYRTGDRVRSTGGRLEYLGRGDEQVKIRGFRVEVAEVEAALRALDGIRDAVVQVVETGHERQLVAYVVSADAARSSSDVLGALATRLPAYMVPSRVVWLDRIPLGPTGKPDRRAVLELSAQAGTPFIAPADALEEAIAHIWGEVLQRPTVGRDDNFFAVGGHSLLATQLVSRLRAGLRADFSIRDLFEFATVADQARALVSREKIVGMSLRIAEVFNTVRRLSPEQAAELLARTRV